MAELSPKLPQSSQDSVPFWRDIRVLGVLAQIAFVIVVVISISWLVTNILGNLTTLGENQFLCRDGTSSVRCAFDFLRLDAQFDISETLITYDPSDSYARALLVGLGNTIRVTVFGVILATILGTFVGIARLSSNWLISSIAKWYVDIMRNTPLLLQLFFLFFGVILLFPPISEAIQLFGLPIYLSQRGINMPWFVFMPSAGIWLAFLVGAIVLVLVLWVMLSRQEERTGKARNRPFWVLLAFLVVIGIGWAVSGRSTNSQAMLVARAQRIRTVDDMAATMARRLGVNELANVSSQLESGAITEEQLNAAAYQICALKDDPAEVNLTAQLRTQNIPYAVTRYDRADQATEAYVAGECEIYVARSAVLAGERAILDDAANHSLVSVPEVPVRISVPRIEGLNFVGGLKLTPNFAAILIGLVLYTGSFIAEIVRAGIQSVAKGQSEAARALGLSESQRLQLVVLPQALRVIIPPMTSQYLNLAKNSSLAIAVGYPDLWSTAFTTLNQSGRAIQVFVLVMGVYLTLSLSISFLLNWYNRRIALVER